MPFRHRPAAVGGPKAIATMALVICTAAVTACGSPQDAARSPASASEGPVAASSSTPDAAAPSRPVDSASAATSLHTVASIPSARPSPLSSAQIRAQVAAKVAAISAGLPAGSVSVAALNTVTGAQFGAGATSGMWTASDYKLLVLETLLLQHQQAGTSLSGGQLSQATTMIENSDNVAGYSLFEQVGGNAGLRAALQQFGMTNTVPGRTDPTFTTTSASDYLILLLNLISSHGPLNASSRALALDLMRNVESDQRWGVGAIADPGTTFANKNGWLSVEESNGPGEDDDDLWVVNSAGVVTVHGQQVLMMVMTEHRPSYQDGVNLVQSLAQAIRAAVAP